MTELLYVILLGIIEGVTEFLPISSTGHLIAATHFFHLPDDIKGTFEVFIQLGAVLAVALYYRRELLRQIRDVRKKEKTNTRRLWLGIVIAFMPAAILGLILGNFIDTWLFRSEVVAIGFIAGGMMFLGVERYLTVHPDETSSVDEKPLTFQQALIIGLWQTLALIPGMSRSGMSIIGAMMAGVDRKRATQFSFYLALPTLGSATIYTLLKHISTLSIDGLEMLLLGTAVSGVVAWLSIDWLLRYVARHSFVPFGYYRIVCGLIILAFRYNLMSLP